MFPEEIYLIAILIDVGYDMFVIFLYTKMHSWHICLVSWKLDIIIAYIMFFIIPLLKEIEIGIWVSPCLAIQLFVCLEVCLGRMSLYPHA